MPAVIPRHDETRDNREAEIETSTVAGVERAGELGGDRLTEQTTVSTSGRKELAHHDGYYVAEEENAETGRNARGMAFHRYRTPLTELGADPKRRRAISRRGMVPGRGCQLQIVMTS